MDMKLPDQEPWPLFGGLYPPAALGPQSEPCPHPRDELYPSPGHAVHRPP